MIESLTGEFKPLSNYFDADVTYEGLTYRTAANAFMAQFFKAEVQKKAFTNALSNQATLLFKKQNIKLSDEEQLNIMHDILVEKLNQHEDIKEILLNSEGEIINHVPWNDQIWGVCNGEGENRTGKLLEQIREEFKSEAKKKKSKKEKKEKLDNLVEELKESGLDGDK